jgi:hypothetical protein
VRKSIRVGRADARDTTGIDESERGLKRSASVRGQILWGKAVDLRREQIKSPRSRWETPSRPILKILSITNAMHGRFRETLPVQKCPLEGIKIVLNEGDRESRIGLNDEVCWHANPLLIFHTLLIW